MNFDIKSIKREFAFGVMFSQLKESNIWSTNYYDRLYVKAADSLKKCNAAIPLKEVVNIDNGDEVGSGNYYEFIQRNFDDKPFIRTSDIVNWEVDLYPDYYISENDLVDIKQNVKTNDAIFTKDGKIGCVGLITETDNVVLSSGIEILRVKDTVKKKELRQSICLQHYQSPKLAGMQQFEGLL